MSEPPTSATISAWVLFVVPLVLGVIYFVAKRVFEIRDRKHANQTEVLAALADALQVLGKLPRWPERDDDELIAWFEEREDQFERLRYLRARTQHKGLRARLVPLELLGVSIVNPSEDDRLLRGFTELREFDLRRVLGQHIRQAVGAVQSGRSIPDVPDELRLVISSLVGLHRRGLLQGFAGWYRVAVPHEYDLLGWDGQHWRRISAASVARIRKALGAQVRKPTYIDVSFSESIRRQTPPRYGGGALPIADITDGRRD